MENEVVFVFVFLFISKMCFYFTQMRFRFVIMKSSDGSYGLKNWKITFVR